MKRNVYRTAGADGTGTTRTDAAPAAPPRVDVATMSPDQIRAAVEVEIVRRDPAFRADAAMTAGALIDRLCAAIGYPPPDPSRSVYYRGQYALTSASYVPARPAGRADAQDRRDDVPDVDRETAAREAMERNNRLAAIDDPAEREAVEARYQRTRKGGSR